jgi:hypothetical protein
MEEGGDISTINEYDTLKTDAIEYPLVTINERNLENYEIISMVINYDEFLPTISITVSDVHESEQKINTTQMNGLIKVVMVSPVDKVYRKILLNFRILNVSVNPNDRTRISYYGEFYVEGFRNVNTMHIWMPVPCPKPITCQQGGHINANTWEMLHRIAELTGLGFAATKKCKEIPDHVIRNIYTQRYDQFIEQQLVHFRKKHTSTLLYKIEQYVLQLIYRLLSITITSSTWHSKQPLRFVLSKFICLAVCYHTFDLVYYLLIIR